MTIFTITTNLSSIQGNLLTSSNLLENHYDDYYFGVISLGTASESEDDEYFFVEDGEESAESQFWSELYENEYDTINPVICIASQIGDLGNYIFVNHNAKDMLQGFSEMLTEEDEKADIVVFVPKGRNAESYKDIAKEEIGSLVKNAERVERAIRYAIETAWDKGDFNAQNSFFGYTIDDEKGKTDKQRVYSVGS